MTLAGRHALVTGGGGGIGLAIALALAGEGAEVTVCGRRREVLEQVRGPRIHAEVADVTDASAVAALFRAAEGARGPFDIVVANAGAVESAPAAKLSAELWDSTLAVNLTGAWLTVQPALAAMSARQAGRIVFIASTAALKGYPYVAAYVAAKHGVLGLARALAVEFADRGFTVNAVCPGFTETEMLERSVERIASVIGRPPEDARRRLTNPQGRFVTPEEVAAAVLWLVSDAARSVTGQAISVSGGETW